MSPLEALAAETTEPLGDRPDSRPLRALLPLLNAAVECVAQGLASPEEVDGLPTIFAGDSWRTDIGLQC